MAAECRRARARACECALLGMEEDDEPLGPALDPGGPKKKSLKPRAHMMVGMADARLRGRRSGVSMGAMDAVKMRQFVRNNETGERPANPLRVLALVACLSLP